MLAPIKVGDKLSNLPIIALIAPSNTYIMAPFDNEHNLHTLITMAWFSNTDWKKHRKQKK